MIILKLRKYESEAKTGSFNYVFTKTTDWKGIVYVTKSNAIIVLQPIILNKPGQLVINDLPNVKITKRYAVAEKESDFIPSNIPKVTYKIIKNNLINVPFTEFLENLVIKKGKNDVFRLYNLNDLLGG